MSNSSSPPHKQSPGSKAIPWESLWPARVAWWPVPVFWFVELLLWAANFHASRELPYLLIGLHFFFSVLTALFVAYLLGRSFLANPKPGFLLIGCGALAWGFAGFAGTLGAMIKDPSQFSANTGATIHNTCTWLSALCHLAGAGITVRWRLSISNPPLWLALGYGTVLGLVGFVTFATLADWMPFFFASGQGGTPLRHFVLGSAIAMLVLTVMMLRAMNRPRWSPFAYWYGLGLAMLSVGLFGVMLQSEMGGVLSWTGRIAQYWGGFYMLVAAFVAARQWDSQGVRLGDAVGETRHAYAVAIALVVSAAIVRLVFLQALGLRAAFLTFYPAVMIAALYGGLRAGVLAAALSAVLTDYFWMEPVGSLVIHHVADGLAISVFLLSCLMISATTEAMHRAQSRALGGAMDDDDSPSQREKKLRQRERQLASEQLKAVFPVKMVFPAAVGMLVILAWFAFQNIAALQRFDRRDEQIHQLVYTLSQLRLALVEAEIGADSYVGAGESKFLGTYQQASGRAAQQWAETQRLAEGNPRQRKFLLPLAEPVLSLLEALKQAVVARQADKPVSSTREPESAKVLLAQLDAFRENEIRRLQERGKERSSEVDATMRTGGLGFVFSVLLLSLVYIALRREVAVRAVAERELARHRDRLESLVQERTAELEREIIGHLAAERASLESEEHLQLALQASSMGTFEIDLDSGQGRWNSVEFTLLGLKQGEVIPGPETFFNLVHADDKERVVAEWLEAVRTGQLDTEFRIVRADGEVRWLAGRGRFASVDGVEYTVPIRFLGVNFDITERKEAETARAWLAAIVESSQDAIIGKDLQGIVISWNRGAEELFGYSKEEMIGRPLHMLFPPSRYQDEEYILEQICAGQAVAPYETERLRKDGSMVYVSITVSPVRDATDKIIGASKIARDITARRRAEEERDRYISLVKNSSDFIGMCDMQGVPFFVNEAGMKLMGMDSVEQIPQKLVRDFFFPEDQEYIIHEFLPSTLQTPSAVEVRFRHFKTGEAIWMIYSVFALRGRGDQPIGFATVSRNITERKHMEQALRRSQDDLNRAQAVAHTGSWRMDVRHNVLTWSDENHRIFGIPRGKPLSYETFLGAVHPDDRGFVDRAWTMALAGKPYDIEHRIVVGDTVKWVRERAELEYDEYGFLLGGFGTTQDITELKNSQLALREADRRKDEFLAMLAHELRNPLTPIMVAAQMLQKRGASDPSLVTWAGDTVKHQCDHLVQLVNQLLDVSRVTQGKIALHKSPWDLRELAQRAVDSNKPFIEQHRHRLVVALPAEPMLAEVDAVRIEQVVGNLLNNAAKYTPISGDITLSLERQGDEAVIRVRDNGIGISSAMLPCIFDLFVQDERTLDRAQGGLGIGLALVKTLVEMHGGRVQAHSDGAGKGSQFELHLPLLAHSAGAISSYRGTALQGTPGKSRRILVVDDNDSVRESLVLLIQGMGHEVSEAANGLEALNKAKHARFDVVLLDIGMPGMNGYEVARRLRQDPGLAGLTLIALSGYSQGVDRRESFRAGFDHYLVKPLNPEELNMLLEDLDI